MKRKLLTTMLALMMTASVATVMFGCDDGSHTHTYATEWTTDDTHHWKTATCEHTAEVNEKAEHSWGEDGKCTVCQKEKPVDTTVTQEEWIAFFDSLNTIGFEVEMNFLEMNVNHSFKQHNDVMYQRQTMGETTQTQYVHYDDTTYTMTRYSHNTRDSVWKKYTTVYDTLEEYTTVKKGHMGMGDTVFGFDFASQKSEGVGLRELYSAFLYDADSETYSGNLYYMDGEYIETVWRFKFENRKIVSGLLTQTLDEQLVTMDFTFDYSITDLVIPTEILNAVETN